MSSNAVQMKFVPRADRPVPVTDGVMVGKDVLELLAGSMYVNPLNIFREYVQNAADAIDQARDLGLPFIDRAGVSIVFDHAERSVKIRDNGVGVPSADFVRRLTTIGASQKRGTNLRGFRGVGRLSGLGYCQELIFRGRATGDSKVSELRWDGRALRENLRDKAFHGGLADLIQSVVTLNKLPASDYPERFFEVELRKVSRLRNDVLLNEEVVREYLSQVAPVPFSDGFRHGHKVLSLLREHGIRDPISITLNDGKGPVLHRISSKFEVAQNVFDEVRDVESVEFRGTDGEIAAIGWICDHSYSGSLPKKQGLGGVRLRVGNIQVGDENILAGFFPEARFTGWTIGDIHIVSSKIVPNGRRDEFEPGMHYSHFQAEFSLFAKKITQQIRERSQQRNRFRSIQQSLSFIQELAFVDAERPLPKFLLKIIQELATEKLELANKEAFKLEGEPDQYAIAKSKISEMESSLAEASRRFCKAHSLALPKEIEAPMSTAIRTILTNTKNFRDALSLSVQILNAVSTSH